MRACVLAISLIASTAFAAPAAVYQDENVKVYAYTDKCDVKELAAMLSPHPAHKAVIFFQGRLIKACYVLNGQNIMILDAEGDAGVIPAAAFKEAKNV